MNRNGSGAEAALGVKTTVWSFTPSRIGTIASVTVNSGAAAGCWPVIMTTANDASSAAAATTK